MPLKTVGKNKKEENIYLFCSIYEIPLDDIILTIEQCLTPDFKCSDEEGIPTIEDRCGGVVSGTYAELVEKYGVRFVPLNGEEIKRRGEEE